MTNDTSLKDKEKIKKIDQIKSYLDDLNIKLKVVIKESSSKMQDVVKKKEEKEMKKLLDELKNM